MCTHVLRLSSIRIHAFHPQQILVTYLIYHTFQQFISQLYCSHRVRVTRSDTFPRGALHPDKYRVPRPSGTKLVSVEVLELPFLPFQTRADRALDPICLHCCNPTNDRAHDGVNQVCVVLPVEQGPSWVIRFAAVRMTGPIIE